MRSRSEVKGPTSDDLNTNRSVRPEPKGLTGATMATDLPALLAPAHGQTRSGQVRSGRVRSGQDRTGQVRSGR